jgi:hypothetical protein
MRSADEIAHAPSVQRREQLFEVLGHAQFPAPSTRFRYSRRRPSRAVLG